MTLIVLVAASAAAGVIHLAMGPAHVADLGLLGAGFYLAGGLQLGWAGLAVVGAVGRGALATSASSAAFPVGIGLNGAILFAWLVSRTMGLPAGERPWTPEALGIADGVAALLEAGLVLGCLRGAHGLWTQRATDETHRPVQRGPIRPSSLLAAAPVLALILVATVTAVGTPEASASDGHHAGGTEAHELLPHTH